MHAEKIGFGGGCHWCTEAVFSFLNGVNKVEQGWIASEKPYDSLSEAVIVYFDPEVIRLETLIEIHLRTHSSASDHSMRDKYRSAIYTFTQIQKDSATKFLNEFSEEEGTVVTKVLPFGEFNASPDMYQNYYQKNKNKPFCKTYIDPKLRLIMDRFRSAVAPAKTSTAS